MKAKFLIIYILIPFFLSGQNIGIGTTSPHASAALDIQDSNKGLLIPRSDTSNIITPALGLLLYQIDDLGLYQYNGTKWMLIGQLDNIADADNDTRIEVEESSDEDIIRFYAAGTEVMRQNGTTLEMVNNGQSVFIGAEAGLQDDLTNNNNVFVGHRAGRDNVTGVNNIAVGEQALQGSSSGNNNVAIGKQAMSLNTGSNNVGIGLNALQKNSNGEKNTAIGGFAGFANQTGDRNTLLGYEAGRGIVQDVSGNVMLGHQAGKNEIEGDKLYISNTETSTPLIYGDFAEKRLTIHDELQIVKHLEVGAITGTQKESVELDGAIQIGNAVTDMPASNDAGTMRWNDNEQDFQGWDGSQWLSMTMPNGDVNSPIGIEIDTLPYEITEPGYYYLTKNLKLDIIGQHGIRASSIDDITIELNGFTIEGPGNTGQSNHSGIYLSQADRVTILNGTISNWQQAGVLGINSFTRSTCMYQVFTISNGIGVQLNGSNARLLNCQSLFNLSHGYDIQNNSNLESCHARQNGGSGFKGEDNNALNNCFSNINQIAGFDFENNNIINSCSAYANQTIGIDCDAGNSVADCILRFNRQIGIHVLDYNNLRSNVVTRNNLDALSASGGIIIRKGNKLLNNSIVDNNINGIIIESTSNILDGNDVIETTYVVSNPGKGYTFLSASNAWRNNTGDLNGGGNVSTIQPPADRSLNNWMY